MKQAISAFQRAHNFGPGPAALPFDILKKAQEEFLNFRGTGMSIVEITNLDQDVGTHPGVPKNPLQEVMIEAENNLRKVLSIPDDYRVLFQHGGAVGQFSAIPMNLCEGKESKADYVRTGFWSKRCSIEAEKYCDVHVPVEAKTSTNFQLNQTNIRKDSNFVHFCLNETIQGLEFHSDPEWSSDLPPLVCDATSNLLSRPMDISRYGLIYASGGKNIPAGMCLVIIKEDLLKVKGNPYLPQILDYRASGGGLLPKSSVFESKPNTPPVFPVYLLNLMCEYIINKYGDLNGVKKQMHDRAQNIYKIIDDSNGFYRCEIDKDSRSVMNAVFRIGSEEDIGLEREFYKKAEEQNLNYLFGFESKDKNAKGLSPLCVKGVRVTMYVGVPDEAVDAVCKFMSEFYEANKDKLKK